MSLQYDFHHRLSEYLVFIFDIITTQSLFRVVVENHAYHTSGLLTFSFNYEESIYSIKSNETKSV